jgi:hypothetical protein
MGIMERNEVGDSGSKLITHAVVKTFRRAYQMRNHGTTLNFLRRTGDRFKRFSGFTWGHFLRGTLLVVFRRHTRFLIHLVRTF